MARLNFLSQTLKHFRTTGAIAPSSRYLARAIVEHLPPRGEAPETYRVLEVGPGTGAFTRAIVQRLAGRGHLDLWEINPHFAQALKDKVEHEAEYAALRPRIRLFTGDVRELRSAPTYDAIVSGLPFNNFSPQEVRGFLHHFQSLLKPRGTLSYFEYVGVRKIPWPLVSRDHRKRLTGVAAVVHEYARAHEIRQLIVPLNLPPARVRHLQFN